MKDICEWVGKGGEGRDRIRVEKSGGVDVGMGMGMGMGEVVVEKFRKEGEATKYLIENGAENAFFDEKEEEKMLIAGFLRRLR